MGNNTSRQPQQSQEQARRQAQELAQQRFNEYHFETIEDIIARQRVILQSINGVEELHIDVGAKPYLMSLLKTAMYSLRDSIQGAQRRFIEHQFQDQAIDSCHQAIIEAIGVIGTLNIQDVNERAHYHRLLIDERNFIEAAQRRFLAHRFDEQANIALRYRMMEDAVTNASIVAIDNPTEREYYR